MRNSFLIRGNKMVKPLGMHQQTGRGVAILPIKTAKKVISRHMGRGTTPILLSEDLATADVKGEGFGIKTPKPELISRLSSLNLKGGNKPRNVRLIL